MTLLRIMIGQLTGMDMARRGYAFRLDSCLLQRLDLGGIVGQQPHSVKV